VSRIETIHRRTIAALAVLATACVMGLTSHPAAALAPSIPPSTFSIHNNVAQGAFCLGISGGNAGTWSCTGGRDQTWHNDTSSTMTDSAGHHSYFRLVNGLGECLGVSGGSTTRGSQVVAFTCNTHPDQYWYELPAQATHIWNHTSNNFNNQLLLAVRGGNVTNGQRVVTWNNTNQPDQTWFLL
jgi:hypothetical protein